MKTRIRIVPFHVNMTILKTQIEKWENSKERCLLYLTKRTGLRYFVRIGGVYVRIFWAQGAKGHNAAAIANVYKTFRCQWMKFLCPQVYAKWNASMNNNGQWSILLVEISYLLCSAFSVHQFLFHVLLVKNLIKFPWTFFVRKGEQCDVLIWYLHREVNIVYLNGKIIRNYVEDFVILPKD